MCFLVLVLTDNLETYRNYNICYHTDTYQKGRILYTYIYIYIYTTQAQKPVRNASDLQRSYRNSYLVFVKAKCMNKKIAWRNCKSLKFPNSPVKIWEIPNFPNSKVPKFPNSITHQSNFLEIPKFQSSPVNSFWKFQNSKIPKF